jgi:DNA-binding PadR family transcriptional regulator
MPVHHALLSLLAAGESYGYELHGAFERSAGPQWGTLNIGHLYQVLDRLKRDGLVEVVRSEAVPRRPDRLIYGITGEGRAELERWLHEPSPPATGYRDDLYLKLVAAARAGAETLDAVLRGERRALLAELHALHSLPGDEDPLAGLLVEGAALQVDARLRLLDLAAERIAALAASAAAGAPAQAAGQAEEPPAGAASG